MVLLLHLFIDFRDQGMRAEAEPHLDALMDLAMRGRSCRPRPTIRRRFRATA
jgi:hypothetical protein